MQNKWTLFKFEQYLEIHNYKISHLHKYTICAAGNDDFVQIGLLLPAAPEMTEASTCTLVLNQTLVHLYTCTLVDLCLTSVQSCKSNSSLRTYMNDYKYFPNTSKQNKVLYTVIKQCCEAESICDDKPPSAPLPLSVSSSSPPRFLPSSFTE